MPSITYTILETVSDALIRVPAADVTHVRATLFPGAAGAAWMTADTGRVITLSAAVVVTCAKAPGTAVPLA